MNQPNFVGYAGLSEIFGAVFTRKVYVSIGRNGGIGVGYKWNAAIYFDAVEVYAVRKNLFCHTDFIFVSLRQSEKSYLEGNIKRV